MGGNAFADPRRKAGDSSRLLSAAGAVADDREIDWDELEASTSGNRQHSELRELRVIQAIARFHRELQPAAEPQPMPAGRRLGEFEIVAELGRGGMGIVYEALQVPLGRRVALKVLPAGFALSNAAVIRFRREAHAAALLRHGNIVAVHVTGEADGCPFFAMELVEGPSLQAALEAVRDGQRARLEGTPLGAPGVEPGTRVWFETAARLVAGVADGLAAAHARTIVHRDVKPANLLFGCDGQLRLTDFGLARILEEPGVTVTGAFLGTPAYMSPEQLSGSADRIDYRTDLFSLGAVLYELLTLCRPFPHDSRAAVVTAILCEDPIEPHRLQPAVPRDLETICLKALERDPARRYESAAAMAADLRHFLAREPTAARPAGTPRRLGRFAHRHALGALATTTLLVLAAMGAVTLRARLQHTEESARQALTEARLLFHQGDFHGVVEQAGRALALAPHLADARILKARAFVELAETDQALAEARALLEDDPADWRGHLILAMLGNASPSAPRDLTSVRAHLEAVAHEAPETADVYYLRALATADAADAIGLLDRSLELDPAHGNALLERILRHAERTDFAAALADGERLIVARPRSSLGHVSKGWIHLEQLHDVAAAEQDARRALAVDPDDAAAHALAGAVLQYRVQWEPALAEYARAMQLQPGSAQHPLRRAQLLLRLRRFDEALGDATRASGVDAWSLPARWAVFRAHIGLGDRDAARRDAAELLSHADGSPDPRRRAAGLAAAALMLGELQDGAGARALAERAAALDPSNHLARRAEAQAWRVLGDGARADAICAAAAQLSPPPREERALGRWLDDDCGRPDLYAEVMTRVTARVPQWPEAWYALGIAYQASGRPEDAVRTYRRTLELAPSWAEAWHQYGEMLGLILLRWREALAAYDRSLVLDPWQNGSSEPYFQRSWVRYTLGDLPGALADGQEAYRRSPASPTCAAAVLIAALAQHDCTRAGTFEPIARRLVDGQSNPFFFMGAAHVNATYIPLQCPELADLERARRFAERAVELASPPASRELGALGAVRYRQGRWREAEALLRRVLREDATDEPTLRLYRAMALARLGRGDEARAERDRAVASMRARDEERRPDLVALRQEVERILRSPGESP
jgi:hypothetical protein